MSLPENIETSRGPQASPPSLVARSLTALRNPGYRLLWGNSFFASNAWILESLAMGWLVLALTDSAFLVGLAAGLRGLGMLFLGPAGGMIADRLPRRSVIIAGQAANTVFALVTALLVFTGLIQAWHLMALAFLTGAVSALFVPSRFALIFDLVGKEALLNATATGFFAFSASRIVGASLGGLLMNRWGPASVYLLVAASFLSGILMLSRLSPPRQVSLGRESPWTTFSVGIAYGARTPLVRNLLLLSLVTEVFGFSYFFMIPVVARDVLHVDVAGYGLLTGMPGVGALCANAVVASLGDVRNKGTLLLGFAGAFGLSLLLFALSPWFLLSLGLAMFVGATSTGYDSMLQTVYQSIVPEEMRGRMIGLLALTYGTSPLGSIQAGAMSDLMNPSFAVGLGGVVVAMNAVRLVPLARQVNS